MKTNVMRYVVTSFVEADTIFHLDYEACTN